MKDKVKFSYAEPNVEVITLDSSDVIHTSKPILKEPVGLAGSAGWDASWSTVLGELGN